MRHSAGPGRSSAKPVLHIEAGGPDSAQRIRDLWTHRELLAFLAWRDVAVRYKQTTLGVIWALLQPSLATITLAIFFGSLARVPSEGVPYAALVLVALVPWQFFSQALTVAGNSLVANERLVTKVYFPRAILPLASVLAGMVELLVSAPLIGVVFVVYGIQIGPAALAVPVYLLLLALSSIGVASGLSGLTARFRDARHAVPFLAQVWLFVTPVAYPSSIVPERFQSLYALNPMVGVIDGLRHCLLGTPAPSAATIAASAIGTGALLWSGLAYLWSVERELGDAI
jgi:lipopolysaccharide transport system permease protein